MKKLLLFTTFLSALSLYAQKRTVAPVYTTTTQSLTNKSIDADANTLTNIENADIKAAAAIDATKIANGSVSNTEFQYVDGVTSGLQTQLDNRFTKGGDTGSDLYLGSNDAYNLVFKTDGINRLWINSSGGIALGTTASNDFKFQIYGSGSNGSNGVLAFGDAFGTSTPYVAIEENGGTDSDQLNLFGQKGAGISTGTYGSTHKVWVTQAGAVCINTETPVTGAELTVSGDVGISQTLNLQGAGTFNSYAKYKATSTPSTPANGTEANIYVKSNKLIIQYNDGGTVRYKYLDLTGTGITWTHTTTAP